LRTGFYGSSDPANSVKALKEDRVLRIRLHSRQVHPTIKKHKATATALEEAEV